MVDYVRERLVCFCRGWLCGGRRDNADTATASSVIFHRARNFSLILPRLLVFRKIWGIFDSEI